MNTKKIRIIGVALISFISLICVLYFFLVRQSVEKEKREIEERVNLAQELGVRIDDYPYPKDFPVGYIKTEVKPGMQIAEVHEIVRGYEKVYRCGKYSEVYYFYSDDDWKALRVEIVYDKMKNFKELRLEDSNSRTIQVFDCIPGLLQ